MLNKFSIYDQSLQISAGDTPAFQQELVPAQDDVNWFSVEFGKIGQGDNIADKVVERLQNASNDLKTKREELNEQFKNAQKNDSFVAMANTARLVSEYGFQTALMAKVISKSTQSVEKLTNLQ